MQAALQPWLGNGEVILDLADIDDDPALLARYGDRVPVLFLDDEELCYGRLDQDLLEEALARR